MALMEKPRKGLAFLKKARSFLFVLAAFLLAVGNLFAAPKLHAGNQAASTLVAPVEGVPNRSGDRLSGLGGELQVFGHQVRFAKVLVFNLRAPGAHAFRVGRFGGLVHKQCGGAKGGASIPGKPFRGPDAAKRAFGHLEKHHGLDPKVASNRLHKLKENGGLGAADDVVIGKTGDVYNASTGERLGTLTDKALGRER
jgi:hypothetical protein